MPFADPTPDLYEPDYYKGAPSRKGPNWAGIAFLVAVMVVLLSQWSSIKTGIVRMTGGHRDNIPWRVDLDAALIESQRTGTPVLVAFTANWSPLCQNLKEEVWPDPKIQKLASTSFLPVAMNVDLSAAAEVAAKYHIPSPPYIIVLDGKGTVIQQGAPSTRDDMVALLKSALAY